uniref:Uncharacterized protein n=1 Tax=Babesia bovis TaxID=5865 RepID=A7AUC5_BABBO|eukprot:XP_001610104.1 hypothetical protein [Babesia bovis T2Bo]
MEDIPKTCPEPCHENNEVKEILLVEHLSLKLGKLDSPTYSYNFECVVLQHPAFFEFCGTNKRIGAADLCKHVYRFWNMNNYELVFEIKGKGYQEIRVSDGVVVMLSQPRHNYIPLSLYDIEDGTLLRPRKFFTLSKSLIEFWELTRYNLVRTNQLVLQGMDNPDICCHSLWANLLFVRAFKEQPLFGSITASPSSDSTQTNPLCHHHPKLLRRNERVHTPSKMSKESCEADILKQNEETLQKHGILLFTLDGSNYLGEIDQEIIDSNIETLALSNDLSVIACGSDEGEVSIMRMPNYIING